MLSTSHFHIFSALTSAPLSPILTSAHIHLPQMNFCISPTWLGISASLSLTCRKIIGRHLYTSAQMRIIVQFTMLCLIPHCTYIFLIPAMNEGQARICERCREDSLLCLPVTVRSEGREPEVVEQISSKFRLRARAT